MTNMWYWVITGFGFLFSLRAVRARAGEKRTDLSLRNLWRDALDLFVSLLFLVTLYDAGMAWERSAYWFREYDVMIFWIAAYLTGKYQKKSELFFLSLAVVAFMIVAFPQPWGAQFFLCMAVTVGIFIFQALFKGLKYALIFTRTPETMKGWPVLCLLAFCLTIILNRFAILIF